MTYYPGYSAAQMFLQVAEMEAYAEEMGREAKRSPNTVPGCAFWVRFDDRGGSILPYKAAHIYWEGKGMRPVQMSATIPQDLGPFTSADAAILGVENAYGTTAAEWAASYYFERERKPS